MSIGDGRSQRTRERKDSLDLVVEIVDGGHPAVSFPEVPLRVTQPPVAIVGRCLREAAFDWNLSAVTWLSEAAQADPAQGLPGLRRGTAVGVGWVESEGGFVAVSITL